MANSEVCTLYDRKIRSNLYNFLQITRVHALLLSVSFKPIFVDFTSVIGMLALSAVCHRVLSVRYKILKFPFIDKSGFIDKRDPIYR